MKIPTQISHSGRFLTAIGLGLVTAVAARAEYKDIVLRDGPLAYYALDASIDSGTVADLSGNGNDALNSNVASIEGPSKYIPYAGYFSGGQGSCVPLDYINNPELLNFAGPITLEAWVRPDLESITGGLGNIIAKGYDSAYNKEIVLRADGSNGARYTGGSGTGSGVSGGVQSTNWVYLVLTSDGTKNSLYVNKTLVAEAVGGTGSVTFPSPWRIGTGSGDYGDTRFFRGSICQAAIYNKALTATQVQEHYFMGLYDSLTPPPAITSNPSPSQTYVGGNSRFTVSVDSGLPPSYQWYKGATLLPNQTNATLTLTNVQTANTGSYTVTVTNTSGAVTSSPAILTVVVPGTYAAAVVADQPLAYYPLNETSGDTVVDWFNGFNGTYQNSPVLGGTGPSTNINNRVTFNGANQIANLGNRSEMNISGKITMEAWVQASATPAPSGLGYIVTHGLGYNPGYREVEMKAENGGFSVEEYGVDYKKVAKPYASGDLGDKWVHLVGTYDGTNWNLYYNGTLSGSLAGSVGAITVPDSPWAIGGSGTGGRNFQGAVSQVAIYDHALTPSQIAAHYHLGLVGTTNPPPSITSDLTARSVFAGATLHLSVGVDSAMPLTYTWYKGATALVGQTNAMLVLTNIQASDAGNYKVTATSQAGSVTSAPSALTVLSPGLYSTAIMADKPLAYYPLSESSGTEVIDYAGGFNGVYKNSPTLGAAGPTTNITSSVSFDGSYADLGNFGNAAGMNFAGAITMEAWVQPNDVGIDGNFDIIAKGFTYNPYGEVQMRAKANNYEAGCVGGGGINGVTKTLNWTHLVSTCDGANWSIYADGVLINQAPGGGVPSYLAPWAIASGSLDGLGRYFRGKISQVALYDHALTAAQVAGHYQIGKFGSYLPPVISVDPISSSAYVGATVRMTVKATSALPMSYAWSKGVSLLPSQTNDTLILANVQASNAGDYTVVVSNLGGSDTSMAARLTVVASGVYGAAVISDKPLAYYPLNETTGTTVIDYAGQGFNGTYNNSPVLGVAGLNTNITSGVSFNGDTGQIADLGNRPEMNISGRVTMEAWVQAGINDNGYIVGHGLNMSPTVETELKATSSGFDIEEYGVYYKDTVAPYQAGDTNGDWVHVVGTWDGANWNIYRNGVLAASNPSSGGVVAVADCPWAIGGSGTTGWGGRNYKGVISQVAIYDHALTPTQVLAHYEMGKFGKLLAPTITADPNSRTAYAGATVKMNVAVSSSAAISYAWFKGATPLSSQTNATLVLTNVQASDNGSYTVTVSDQAGSDTSAAAILTVVAPGAYAAAMIADHPLAYYPLNETSGNTALDYAGQGFNGTYANSPVLGVTGPSSRITSAVSVDGAYVDLNNPGNAAGMNVSGAITMEAWIKPNDIGSDGAFDILAKGYRENPYNEIVLRARDNDYEAGCVGGGSVRGGTKNLAWTHLIVACDNATWSMYVNGVLVNQSAGAGPSQFSAPWAIANGTMNGAGRYFRGTICQVAIYDHALSASQAQAHFLAGQEPVVIPTPVVNSIKVSGGNLVFSGTNGVANGSYSVLTSTNIAAPVTDWTVIETGACDANGAFSVTNAFDSAKQRFYRIKLQ